MNLTPEEQALLDARRAMLAAGDALAAAYARMASAIAQGLPERPGAWATEALAAPAEDYDRACRAYDAAFRAAYGKRIQ